MDVPRIIDVEYNHQRVGAAFFIVSIAFESLGNPFSDEKTITLAQKLHASRGRSDVKVVIQQK